MAAGDLIRNVPADVYHRWPGISPSKAKYAIESALAYKAALDTPFEPSDEMNLGSACHFAVWEPDMLPLKCVVWEGGNRRGKTWDDFKAANAAKLILTESQFATVLRVRDRCQLHPKIKAILAQKGEVEISMRWQDTTTDTLTACRSRSDFIADRIYDLKTTHDISDRAVRNAVTARLYHMQMAAYQIGYEAATGEEKPCVLVFAQTKQPYDARVIRVEGEELKRGAALWSQALDTINAAEQAGHYAGIDEEESPLILPEWALDSDGQVELTLDGMAVGL